MRGSDIVIIGGGVVGASVAYHLVKRGAGSVVIFEKESEQGRGSTGKATGGVRAQFATDINIQMSLYSIDFFSNWDRDCGYDPKGYLFFATTAEHLERLRQGVERQRRLGYSNVDLIDVKEVADLVPGMNCEDIVGGSFGRRDGFIDPLAVMHGLTAEALNGGATIKFNSDVSAINARSGRVCSVSTDRGEIGCDTVVLCTGAWSKSLAATAGIELPVEPQKRQIVWARLPDELPPNMPMVIDLGTGLHFRTAPGGEETVADSRRDVLFAYPETSEECNTDVDDAFVGRVCEKARHRAAFLSEAEVVRERCRAGFYENTPDRHAIIGGCEIGGLYFANGFSGHGVMHAPATGRAVAEIVLDGEATFLDVTALRLERFAKGEHFRDHSYI